MSGGKDEPKEVGGDTVLVDSGTVEKFLSDHPGFQVLAEEEKPMDKQQPSSAAA